MSTTGDYKYWRGIAQVAPLPGNSELGTADGAYVGIVAIAGNSEDFLAVVRNSFRAMNFHLVDVEEIEMVETPFQLDEVARDIREQMANLSPDRPFGYGTFHTYRNS